MVFFSFYLLSELDGTAQDRKMKSALWGLVASENHKALSNYVQSLFENEHFEGNVLNVCIYLSETESSYTSYATICLRFTSIIGIKVKHLSNQTPACMKMTWTCSNGRPAAQIRKSTHLRRMQCSYWFKPWIVILGPYHFALRCCMQDSTFPWGFKRAAGQMTQPIVHCIFVPSGRKATTPQQVTPQACCDIWHWNSAPLSARAT